MTKINDGFILYRGKLIHIEHLLKSGKIRIYAEYDGVKHVAVDIFDGGIYRIGYKVYNDLKG